MHLIHAREDDTSKRMKLALRLLTSKYDFVVSPTVSMKRVICQSVMNN